MWDQMARSGVESVRAVFDWSEAQSEPGGPISFHETDPLVSLSSSHGAELLPVVMYAPAWARVIPDTKASAPADVAAYAHYIRALASRYGPTGAFWDEHPELPRRPLRAWQVWNEPHMRYQWTPRTRWQKRYGKLLRAAGAALRTADPEARVVLAGLTNFSWAKLDELYRLGGIDGRFDVVALHTYTREAGNLIRIIRRSRSLLRRRGDGHKPIWVTEFGASASAGRIQAEGNEHLQTTDQGLAQLVTRMYDFLARKGDALGVERAYWYTWASSYDRSTGGIFDFSGLMLYRGLLVEERPALAAYRRSAERHEGCSKDGAGTCVTGR
jgi:hypothetical protein